MNFCSPISESRPGVRRESTARLSALLELGAARKTDSDESPKESSTSRTALSVEAPAPPATPDVVRLGASLADVSVDDKADQMAKWDAAGATLAASAAAVWGGNGAGLRP